MPAYRHPMPTSTNDCHRRTHVDTNPPYSPQIAQGMHKKLDEANAQVAAANERFLLAIAGITTPRIPTTDEVEQKRQELRLEASTMNVAVAGLAGQGRTRFVRAMVSLHEHYSATNSFVWFDLEGAGSPETSQVDYFYKQGLYAFDVVVIVVCARFTALDMGIAKMCSECGVRYIFVRTRSDQLILEVCPDLAPDNLNSSEGLTVLRSARGDMLCALNQLSQRLNIPEANDSFFLVSCHVLRDIAKGKSTTKYPTQDERALLGYFQKLPRKGGVASASVRPWAQNEYHEESPRQTSVPYTSSNNDAQKFPQIMHNNGPCKTINSSALVSPPMPQSNSVRMAIIGGHSTFNDFMRVATKCHYSIVLKSIMWSFIEYPEITRDSLDSFLPNEALKGLRAVIVVVDDWISELHTYAAKRCGELDVACLFVQSKNANELERIERNWSCHTAGGVGYREAFRQRLAILYERFQINAHPSSFYLINNLSLLLITLSDGCDTTEDDSASLLSDLKRLASSRSM